MPTEPADPSRTSPPSTADLEALERAVALVRAHLAALAERRRRDAVLTEGWQGGHRARFEERAREIEVRVRRVVDDLALVALAQRRALDATVTP